MLNFEPLRTLHWLRTVFRGYNLSVEERVLRFTEEVLELGQAEGMTREQAHALVDQVHDKPVGEVQQELGGTLVTLASYLAVSGQDPNEAYDKEWRRVQSPTVIDRIREKHTQKKVVSSSEPRFHNP